jgi:hypothetical protein
METSAMTYANGREERLSIAGSAMEATSVVNHDFGQVDMIGMSPTARIKSRSLVSFDTIEDINPLP